MAVILRRAAFRAALFLIVLALLPSCSLLILSEDSDFTGRFARTDKILVVVDGRRSAVLEESLARYHADLGAAGVAVLIERWDGGTAAGLRALLAERWRVDDIDGVFLVGDLPAAWYAQYANGYREQFPCDLYLMDPESDWGDANGDAVCDSHSPLNLKFYVSRISGPDEKLVRYFEKLRRFRAGERSLPAGALVFKDDDWFEFRRGSAFGLSLLYDRIDVRETDARTRRADYADALGGAGAEFVYQWIHSNPPALYVEEAGSFSVFGTVDIARANPKGLFYNLYDCSAARFTEPNLGMSYLLDTDHALAVFGSTKVGGCYYPLVFHQVLAERGAWGDAFLNWYNDYGRRSDSWFLGMVILGDPALVVSERGPIYRFADPTMPVPPDAETIRTLERIEYDYSGNSPLGSFEDYRRAHPEFF